MALINSDVVPFTGGAYEIEQSLRFNDDDSAYLSWTPSSAGNRKTWTWSGWVKKSNILTGYSIGPFICAGFGNSTAVTIGFNPDTTAGGANERESLYVIFGNWTGASSSFWSTNALYRDASAWYHIVVAVDTTQSSFSDRVKLYVNGEQITSWYEQTNSSVLTQNSEWDMGNSVEHKIGRRGSYASNYKYDGYLAEVNFIDGQALDSSYFGKTGDYGEWKPIEYTGTYGTNGFYLPFKNDYQVEGMSSTLFTASGQSQYYVGGVGFQPDLVWMKKRGAAENHYFIDQVRGGNNVLITNSTSAEVNTTSITSFDTDGFIVDSNLVGGSSPNYVAWCWDMGGSNASNTNGTITSTVRANPTYGQSIVSYTGTGATGTVGHGLSSTPEFVIIKRRDSADNWIVQRQTSNILTLHTTNAEGSAPNFIQSWDSTTFQLGDGSNTPDTSVGASGGTYIAYCFHSVSGYSKFGSYEGTSAVGNSITGLGFEPAFLMIKNIDDAGYDWNIYDNVRTPVDTRNIYSKANSSSAENVETVYNLIDFDSDGFTLQGTVGQTNLSGSTYIYMAFADTREFAYWLDQSGNNNDWTSNNLTESDISVDSPTNNFATLNPLDYSGTFTTYEGNLKYTSNTGVMRGSMASDNQKMYLEYCQLSTVASSTPVIFGIGSTNGRPLHESNHKQSIVVHLDNGTQNKVRVFIDNAQASNVAYSNLGSVSVGDIFQFAYDPSSGKAWVGHNNTWLDGSGGTTGNPSSGTNPTYTFSDTTQPMTAYVDHAGVSHTGCLNFGQDSSFAGNKTAQGNTDSNSIGDFYYTPPSGYLALCTANLPDPAVIPSEHFNTIAFTSGSSSTDVTVGFQPDFVWHKLRSSAENHYLIDQVRGGNKVLVSNSTNAEATTTAITSWNTSGYTVDANLLSPTSSYVSWNWKANGSGVSNTNGSITSTVSANQDAGFSIVSFTSTGSDASIGHGLSQAPEIVISKNRTASGSNWMVGTDGIGWNKFLYLNSTIAEYTYNAWQNTAPTSSVYYVSNSNESRGNNGDNMIAYCFHSVDGFSKVGSYTGNGSTDGTFVYTGFRPAFVMFKLSSNSGEGWVLNDTSRSPTNVCASQLLANSSGAEVTGDANTYVDVLSNGFKIRTTAGSHNTSGYTYIYIAFAEVPAKFSNGR